MQSLNISTGTPKRGWLLTLALVIAVAAAMVAPRPATAGEFTINASTTPQVLDEARELIRKRLADLDQERARLERALKELGGKAKKRPGRPRGSSNGSGAKGPTRRRRRKGGRADQAAEAIANEPGLAANAIAKKLKIKPNYLYRVLGDLEKAGRVKKKGRQYFSAGQKPRAEAKG